MQHLKEGSRKETMHSHAARLQTQPVVEKSVLPKEFNSAIVRFEPADAAVAFDVLVRGGQYGIVGKFTYSITVRHMQLLDEAKIPYHLESVT
jgi:hypothetical protein